MLDEGMLDMAGGGEEGERRVPVTIVTGALGSGKTTLLRHVMNNQPEGYKVCVVQNEVSEFVVEDAEYVGSNNEGFEKYVELPNGCVCCSVRDDFVNALEALSRKDLSLDHIIVETSGLADPGAVASVFWVDAALEGALVLDGVVAVVDAAFLPQALAMHRGDAARLPLRQIAFADLILINKIDLLALNAESSPPSQRRQLPALPSLDPTLDPAPDCLPDAGDSAPDGGDEHTIKPRLVGWTLDQILSQVRTINPLAEVLHTERCDVPLDKVLHRGAFDLARHAKSLNPVALPAVGHSHGSGSGHGQDHGHGHGHGDGDSNGESAGEVQLAEAGAHTHDKSLRSVAFEALAHDIGNADMRAACLWLDTILYEKDVPGGGEVFRVKALLSVEGQQNKMVFQGVHTIFDHEEGTEWADERYHRVVLIGRDLSLPAIRSSFVSTVCIKNEK